MPRTSLLRKKKEKSLAWYKKKLWSVFAQFIKIRDKNICFTCGRYCEGKNCHGGHFVKASICGLLLYFHEKNVHVQCANCNIWLDGNQYEYGKRLKSWANKLMRMRLESRKTVWDRAMYQRKIVHYENKIKKLSCS